jgi:hypothetical protein
MPASKIAGGRCSHKLPGRQRSSTRRIQAAPALLPTRRESTTLGRRRGGEFWPRGRQREDDSSHEAQQRLRRMRRARGRAEQEGARSANGRRTAPGSEREKGKRWRDARQGKRSALRRYVARRTRMERRRRPRIPRPRSSLGSVAAAEGLPWPAAANAPGRATEPRS